jgi:hypothetical protein
MFEFSPPGFNANWGFGLQSVFTEVDPLFSGTVVVNYMITEDGNYMITEITEDKMITEY